CCHGARLYADCLTPPPPYPLPACPSPPPLPLVLLALLAPHPRSAPPPAKLGGSLLKSLDARPRRQPPCRAPAPTADRSTSRTNPTFRSGPLRSPNPRSRRRGSRPCHRRCRTPPLET